jgi:arginyl-tRNA--protein-N-Asp/Glu arginylyltransferase
MSKRGLISYKHDNSEKCEICIQAKMTKKPFPTVHRNSQILQIIHSDICELNGILTRGGKRYFITFIDDFSRYTYVYLMKNKDEAFDMFKRYKSEVENHKEKKIKILRTDRGGEYFPH